MITLYEDRKLYEINGRKLYLKRPGLKYYFLLFDALLSNNIQGLVNWLPYFLFDTSSRKKGKKFHPLSGRWKVADVFRLANAAVGFNTPKIKQKKSEDKEIIRSIDFNRWAGDVEYSVLRVMPGWTIEYIRENISFCDAMRLIENHRKTLQEENIRQMMNIGCAICGKINDYIRSIQLTEEHLDEWAQELGFDDYRAFEEAEKKRWGWV
jgi:hypothetical protein